MRLAVLPVLAIFTADPVLTQETFRPRPATEAEIRANLAGAASLIEGANGYEYKPGGTIGYKISKGKICVRKRNDPYDCVDVKFDGKKLHMIDRRGDREFFK